MSGYDEPSGQQLGDWGHYAGGCTIAPYDAGDDQIGRGAKLRGLCDDPKVSEFGRDEAIKRFTSKLNSDHIQKSVLWSMSGRRLVCQSKASQRVSRRRNH